MRILKTIVFFCFVAIVTLIILTQIQLPEVREYQLEISDVPLPCTGWMPLDVIASSFLYMLKSPTITSSLLIFMYYVGVGIASYVGTILGLIVAIIERGKSPDFLFILSFIGCAFFAVFTTLVAILV